MGYVVTTYRLVPGTGAKRKIGDTRPSTLARAVRAARVLTQSGKLAAVATVAVTGPHGRTLLGTATEGEFKPARAYAAHANPTQETPTMSKNDKKATETSPEFTVLAWDAEKGKLKKKATYKTEGGAHRAAEKLSATKGIRNVDVYGGGDTKTANRLAQYIKGKLASGKATTAPAADEAPVAEENVEAKRRAASGKPATTRAKKATGWPSEPTTSGKLADRQKAYADAWSVHRTKGAAYPSPAMWGLDKAQGKAARLQHAANLCDAAGRGLPTKHFPGAKKAA